MKLVKITNYEKMYINKEGKEVPSVNYELRCDNGLVVNVKPCFPNDFIAIRLIAEKEVIGEKK